MNEGLRVRCGSRSSPLRVGRGSHDRSGHAGLVGSGNPGSDRGETGRTAEGRRGPRKTENPAGVPVEAHANRPRSAGIAEDVGTRQNRSRSGRGHADAGRGGPRRATSSIQQLRRSVRRPTRVRSTPGTAAEAGLRRRHGASDLDPRRTRNRLEERGGASGPGRAAAVRRVRSSRGTDMTMTMHAWATARQPVRSETADPTAGRLPKRPTAGPERQDQNDRTRVPS